MMKIFRNKEFKKSFALYCLLSLISSAIAFQLKASFGFLMLSVCIAFLLVFFITTYKRYKKISDLSSDIDKILHGETVVPIEKYSEGELGILHSEIYKMTIRLREQSQNLQDDKIYLANSLADISHQIRTPLTTINLLVSFLSDSDITDERRQKVSHELYDLLSRIDWLITALLKISKLDAGTVQFKTERLPFSELIQKSAAPILVPMELHDQSLNITTNGSFLGDICWTCEAITNIIKNCMEHTPIGGSISIYTSENALFSEIVISDTGSGIAKKDLPHIFERFYKGENSDDKSFGIGLALARMIISAQNGTIKAENNLDTGAKFTIRFYKGTV